MAGAAGAAGDFSGIPTDYRRHAHGNRADTRTAFVTELL
jgi:hypothetical protein